MSIRTKILEKGRIVQEQLIRLLIQFDTRISTLEEDSSGDSSLAEDVEALQTAVGDASGGLVKDVADIKTAIGDESTANSILGRIKALEDAE